MREPHWSAKARYEGGVIHEGLHYVLTCTAFPEQYDVFVGSSDEITGYIRMRGGCLSVTCPDVDGEDVLYAEPEVSEGWFEDDERPQWMDKCHDAILHWRTENTN